MLLAGLGVYAYRLKQKKAKAASGLASPVGGLGPPELAGRERVPARHELDVVRGPGEMRELGDAYLPLELGDAASNLKPASTAMTPGKAELDAGGIEHRVGELPASRTLKGPFELG